VTGPKDATRRFEGALAAPDAGRYVLRLYVAGGTPQSLRALRNLKAICAAHLEGRFELDVVDVYQEPGRARDEQVLAVPTLIKALPEPPRRLIGDLSDTARVLRGLNLPPGPASDAPTDPNGPRRR
jgi:circadian clock protein KaiB